MSESTTTRPKGGRPPTGSVVHEGGANGPIDVGHRGGGEALWTRARVDRIELLRLVELWSVAKDEQRSDVARVLGEAARALEAAGVGPVEPRNQLGELGPRRVLRLALDALEGDADASSRVEALEDVLDRGDTLTEVRRFLAMVEQGVEAGHPAKWILADARARWPADAQLRDAPASALDLSRRGKSIGAVARFLIATGAFGWKGTKNVATVRQWLSRKR